MSGRRRSRRLASLEVKTEEVEDPPKVTKRERRTKRQTPTEDEDEREPEAVKLEQEEAETAKQEDGLNYEQLRAERIRRNREMLEELGIAKVKDVIRKTAQPKKAAAAPQKRKLSSHDFAHGHEIAVPGPSRAHLSTAL